MTFKKTVIASCLVLQANIGIAADISPKILVEINRVGAIAQQVCLSSGKTESQCAQKLYDIATSLRKETDIFCEKSYVYHTQQECLDNEILKNIIEQFNQIIAKSAEIEKQAI